MKDENRKAFKANEAEYLKKFNLTPEQTDAVLKRDYNRMLELGGNIYFTAKLGATDGHSFRHLAATMTGATQEDYAKMMLDGGRSVEGNRSRSGNAAVGSVLGEQGKPKAVKAKSAKAKSAKPKSKAKTRSKSRSKRG
jgi:protocatechuate 4,5-dioxygenase alpha chain